MSGSSVYLRRCCPPFSFSHFLILSISQFLIPSFPHSLNFSFSLLLESEFLEPLFVEGDSNVGHEIVFCDVGRKAGGAA